MTALQQAALDARRELDALRQKQQLRKAASERRRRTIRERAHITSALRKLPIATLRAIAAKHLPCHDHTAPTSKTPS